MFNLFKGFQERFSAKQNQEQKMGFAAAIAASYIVRGHSDLFANMYCIVIMCSDLWQM